MRVRKRNVSLPSDLDQELEARAEGNVSGFVAAAVREKLDRDRDLAALEELWGRPDPELYERALSSIARTRPARPRSLPPT
jgi:hypothetical protein